MQVVIVYIEYHKESTPLPLKKPVNLGLTIQQARPTLNHLFSLCTISKQLENNFLKKKIPVTIMSKYLRYLGKNLIKNRQELSSQNFKSTEGKFKRPK